MTVHFALSGLHLHRPSLAGLRRVSRYAVPAASVAGWIAAGITVAGLGYGWPVAVAALAGGAYLLGAHHAGRRWRTRFVLFAAGTQAGNRALGQQLAHYERVWVERSGHEAAERNSPPDRHINSSYARAHVSNERPGR